MTKSIANLHQYTLDQLADRVAFKVDFFNRLFRSDNIWEAITEQCEKIEKEPRNVSSIILETKKDNGIAIGGSSVTWCHTKLTRIYILLYYLHRDDKIYKVLVFPELLRNMGIYCGEQILNTKINQEIDKIIDLDKMVEEAKKQEVIEPMFKFTNHSRPEMDRLFDKYSDELLFRELKDIIEALDHQCSTNLDVATIWFNSKQIVKSLQEVKRPELFIDRAVTGLVAGQLYDGYKGAQIIMLCVYMMVRSKENDHFTNFIKKMEGLSTASTKMLVIQAYINDMKQLADSKNLYDDYNYFDEQTEPETYTKVDVERMMQKQNDQMEQMKKQMVEMESQLKQQLEEDISSEDVNWHDKVRLDLLLRLMKNAGANLERYGNKIKAAELMRSITDLPLQTCKNYCSDPNLNIKKHEAEILKLNTKLQALDMKIHL